MPHRCVRCGTFYEDGASEILKGCSCGARLFLFVKKKNIPEAEEIIENLSTEEKQQIEEDVYDIIGIEKTDDTPIVLDLESIKIIHLI